MKKYLTVLLMAWIIHFPFVASEAVAQRGQHPQTQQQEQTVMFNTHSLKYHHPSCHWAKKCTVNCIRVKRSEAIQRGGIPCKVCGG
jgi:hypothetical protein